MFLASSSEFGFGEAYPLAVFPILMFHGSQLFVDTIIAGKIADEGGRQPEADTAAEDTVSVEPVEGD